jgi:hypothetical protein
MNPKLGLIFFAAVFAGGCMTPHKQNAIMESWRGHSARELIAAWGLPAQTKSDGSGGRVLIYDVSVRTLAPGPSTSTLTPGMSHFANANDDLSRAATFGSGNESGETFTLRRSRTFWVNSRGTIYRWAWDRL